MSSNSDLAILKQAKSIIAKYTQQATDQYDKLISDPQNIIDALVTLQELTFPYRQNVNINQCADVINCLILRKTVLSGINGMDAIVSRILDNKGRSRYITAQVPSNTILQICSGKRLVDVLCVLSYDFEGNIYVSQAHQSLDETLIRLIMRINMCKDMYGVVNVDNIDEIEYIIAASYYDSPRFIRKISYSDLSVNTLSSKPLCTHFSFRIDCPELLSAQPEVWVNEGWVYRRTLSTGWVVVVGRVTRDNKWRYLTKEDEPVIAFNGVTYKAIKWYPK